MITKEGIIDYLSKINPKKRQTPINIRGNAVSTPETRGITPWRTHTSRVQHIRVPCETPENSPEIIDKANIL